MKLPKMGNLRECSNWKGLTLLTVTSKSLGRVIVNGIKNAEDEMLRKNMLGSGRGGVPPNRFL